MASLSTQALASSPGGRNDRLVHTVMCMHVNFRGMSENSILLPPSAKWWHRRRLELVLVAVFLLLSHMLWDRRIATSS